MLLPPKRNKLDCVACHVWQSLTLNSTRIVIWLQVHQGTIAKLELKAAKERLTRARM